jgi:hypothetical protein
MAIAGRFLGFALFALLFSAPLAAPAASVPDATTVMPLSTLGFPTGMSVGGSRPRFDLYVPDYRSARRMDVRFYAQMPQQIDGSTSVVVRVDGVPVGTSTVAALRGGGSVGGSFSAFKGTGRMLDVSIEAYLTVASRNCADNDPRGLWMRVSPESSIAIVHANAPAATVAEFFEDYDGGYAVSDASGLSDTARLDGIELAYWLNQVERWRKLHLEYGPSKTAGVRKIVVGDEGADLVVRGGVLYVTPRGINLIAAKGERTALTESAEGSVTLKGTTPRSPASLQSLGIGTRTERGVGELNFPVGFSLGTFGGLPQNLQLHLDLAHGPYRSGDRAAVTILLNGAVVNGFSLSQQGKTEHYTVPLDDSRLGGSNRVEVSVEYVPGRETCAGAHATFSVSLLGSSSFSWRGVSDYAPTIGEFFNGLAGHAVVTISDTALDPSAFALLDALGRIDPNVTALAVQRTAGAPMADGVSGEIDVLAPQALGDLPVAYDPATGRLHLTNDAGKTIYAATLDHPSGIIQALRDKMPVLVMTYAVNPSVLESLRVVGASELSAAHYDVLVFNDRGIAYTNPGELVAAKRQSADPVRRSWPLFVIFAVVVIVSLIFIARRALRVS